MESLLFALLVEGDLEPLAVLCIEHLNVYIEADHLNHPDHRVYGVVKYDGEGVCAVCVSR